MTRPDLRCPESRTPLLRGVPFSVKAPSRARRHGPSGAQLAANGYFAGLLDDAAIWDVALSEEEITSLYQLGGQLGYDAADFDAVRDIHVAGVGSIMIDGATWTYASGLADPGGLSRAGTSGTLVLDPTGQTGLTGTGLPEAPAPTVITITDVRHSPAAFEADFAGLNPARMYQLVRSLDLDFSAPTPVDGPRLPAGASDSYQELSPGDIKAFYRLEEMP